MRRRESCGEHRTLQTWAPAPSWRLRRGGSVVAAPSWRLRRGGSVVAAPSWRLRRGGSVVAAPSWRLRQVGHRQGQRAPSGPAGTTVGTAEARSRTRSCTRSRCASDRPGYTTGYTTRGLPRSRRETGRWLHLASALRLDRLGDDALPVHRRPGLRRDPLAPARRAREQEVLAEPFARRGPGASRLTRRDDELPHPVHPSDCCTTAGVAPSAERLGAPHRPADRTFLHSGR